MSSNTAFRKLLFDWIPCTLYVILYVVLDILIASQGHEDPDDKKKRKYDYFPGALILLAEVGKLVFTVIALIAERAAFDASSHGRGYANVQSEAGPKTRRHVELDWKEGLLFSVPAALYTLWNYLNYQSLLHVSLSVYSIIYQSVLFFSALLWSITFNRKLRGMQWFALCLLAVGVFTVHIKENFEIEINPAIILVLSQAMVSAIASVYNEFLYKRPGERDMSINVQNFFLYLWTTICTGGYLAAKEGPSVFKPEFFFKGFNVTVWMIVLVSISLGISVALILKHRDVIVKLFAQAIHSPVEVFAAHYVLGTELSPMIIVAALLIGLSTYLYYMPPKVDPNAAGDKASDDEAEAMDIEEPLVIDSELRQQSLHFRKNKPAY